MCKKKLRYTSGDLKIVVMIIIRTGKRSALGSLPSLNIINASNRIRSCKKRPLHFAKIKPQLSALLIWEDSKIVIKITRWPDWYKQGNSARREKENARTTILL